MLRELTYPIRRGFFIHRFLHFMQLHAGVILEFQAMSSAQFGPLRAPTGC